MVRTQGETINPRNPVMHGSSQGERLDQKEAPLFPEHLLSLLPDLEYIAKAGGAKIIKGRIPILTLDPPGPTQASTTRGSTVRDSDLKASRSMKRTCSP